MTSQDLDMFELPPRYRELQDEARTLAVSIRDVVERADESGSVDPDVRERLRASGLTTVTVPEEYGGRFPAVDSLAVTVIREQLARESAHLDSLFAMQGIGSYAIVGCGQRSGAQALASRRRHPRRDRRARADRAGCGIRPQVDHDDHRAPTATSWSSPAASRSSPTRGTPRSTAFSDARTRATPSSSFPQTTRGCASSTRTRSSPRTFSATSSSTGARVPTDHRIGEPGAGFSLALATLATFRVSVAGAAVGLAEAALDEAVRHTAGRTQFGQPLARIGAVPAALAASWTDIEMARALTYRAAAAATRDARGSLHLSSLAKVGATEAAGRVVDRCVQVMGRFGLVRGSKIERLYREARPMRIYEGATEVIYDSLAKQLVRNLPASEQPSRRARDEREGERDQ